MIDRISSQYSYATIKCCDEHCRINMDRTPRAVVLKGEYLRVKHPQKMCDCLIFRSDMKIILAELKGKNIKPSAVHEKLLNGATEAVKIWSEVSEKTPDLLFVVVAKSFKNNAPYVRIGHDRIKIQNVKYQIQIAKCGSHIDQIMKNYIWQTPHAAQMRAPAATWRTGRSHRRSRR